VKVAVEEFLLPKIKSGFTRHSRNWLKKRWRPLNMRACILNTELLLFCMFWPIKVFISNPTLLMADPAFTFSWNAAHLKVTRRPQKHRNVCLYT
jgi:hypothetical protein